VFALLVSAAGSASHCVRVRVRGKCIVMLTPLLPPQTDRGCPHRNMKSEGPLAKPSATRPPSVPRCSVHTGS
jgi:hypothetical protein